MIDYLYLCRLCFFPINFDLLKNFNKICNRSVFNHETRLIFVGCQKSDFKKILTKLDVFTVTRLRFTVFETQKRQKRIFKSTINNPSAAFHFFTLS